MMQILARVGVKQRFAQCWKLLLIAPSAAIAVTALSITGVMQPLEWTMLDAFFRLRPPEPPDTRIVVVTIAEKDINYAGNWPVSDRILSDVLRNLRAQAPRAIGLDLYRNLPVEPGHDDLVNVFQSTPSLIGAEKRFPPEQVFAHPTLAELDQVAAIDLVEDADNTVRRGLLTAKDNEGQIYLSLATKAALLYLQPEGIVLETVHGSPETYRLGQALFVPFGSNDGGYVGADTGGYQVMLNFRGGQKSFQTISLIAVRKGLMPSGFVRDRVVLIGSTAESIKDCFVTPYNTDPIPTNASLKVTMMPGVFIHANLISQIISAALDGRPFIQSLSDPLEWLWTLAWCSIGGWAVWMALHARWFGSQFFYVRAGLAIALTGGGLVAVSYLLFLGSWWIPGVTPLLGLVVSAIASISLYSQKLQNLAYFDGLTQVANRRYFEQLLAQHAQRKGSLSLILCDIDFFKKYNDTYGHPAGDACLQRAAAALRHAVRQTDIVARYGGEEFAIILPRTSGEAALQVAERVVNQVRDLKIVHASSQVSNYVTISCGVATITIDEQLLKDIGWSPANLISRADKTLYAVKAAGRNHAMLE